MADIGNEQEQSLKIEILSFINSSSSKEELMGLLLASIKEYSGCQAVGIRFHDGIDYPYFQTSGFPPHFIELENKLCEYNLDGEPVRDSDGNPILECMCGNILCGRTNPSYPFFTEKGSFWTNCTTDFIANIAIEERQLHTRNRCNSEGYESVALIPLRVKNKTFGLIQFNDKRKNRFTIQIINLFESLAEAVAIALSHKMIQEELEKVVNELKKSYDREHHIADILQQTLIPTELPVHIEGYDIAVKYQPALCEAEVCGDFYDLFELDDGKIGLVIGDIVGKGLTAAVNIASVRHTTKNYAVLDSSPSVVMTRTNNALNKYIISESEMFTLFFAVLDTKNGTITYTNAGHEPPIVRHSDGNIIYLNSGGPMFTGIAGHNYVEESVKLNCGDIVVLVTDGITEARVNNQSEQFGFDGIISCLSNNLDASSSKISNIILEEAASFAGGILRDDCEVIVIKVKA